MDKEILRRIEEWANSSSSYLSTSTDYARGYRNGIKRAKGIILEIMREVEETYQRAIMKYSWKAKSNDGAFEESGKLFATKEDAYNDMRNHALEKMKWNTEFYDVEEEDTIGYSVHFSKNKIVHESYSGIYTYEIIEVR